MNERDENKDAPSGAEDLGGILPPSGPWSGYYLYGHAGPKHRMKLTLTFTPNGKILGDGIDDIASFTIDGLFDRMTNQASWTKSYVGMHSVEYGGAYNRRSICGDWTLRNQTGGFWIWPSSLEQNQALEAEVAEPTEVVVA